MLSFHVIPERPEPPPPKVSLRQYALFCERCLRSNPAVTPENCLTTQNRERHIARPFCLAPPEREAGPFVTVR